MNDVHCMNQKFRAAFALLLALVLVAAALPPLAHAATTGITNTDVILRTKPSSSSVPLATLRANREVFVLENQGEWCKVRTGTLVGYVMTKYLQNISESPAGASGTASAPSAATPSVLKSGSKGSEVQDLQRMLKTLGFFNEEVTGNFGPVTEAAVKAYQQSRGLTADGVAGAATLQQIAQDSGTSAASAAGASSGGSGGGTAVGLLKQGDEGDAVKQIQQALKNLGFFTGDVTGFFGAITAQALTAYQKANNLDADGVAGAATLNLLLASTAASGGSTIVKLGDKGTQVTSLQTMLKNAGYYSGGVDGDFGSSTQQALIAYQKAKGLTADGVAGTQTLSLLSASGGGTVTAPIVTDSSLTPSSNAGDGTESLGLTGTRSPGVSSSYSGGDIKMVDWWSGEINAVYPRAAIASVMDVRTGISFNIYRYGGTNHLDFEPATQGDTALFNQITGGEYSWNARPVILTVKGVRYAAAMNTMPHGGEHLTDNGISGQLCMHFVNSWTHGGSQPNADMQMQIMAAYNSGR